MPHLLMTLVENESKSDEILKECEIVTLHLPLNQDTKNLFSLDEFEKMRDDALIIKNVTNPQQRTSPMCQIHGNSNELHRKCLEIIENAGKSLKMFENT